jgi:alpha-beta hydrolase superfamily lysophospholipase
MKNIKIFIVIISWLLTTTGFAYINDSALTLQVRKDVQPLQFTGTHTKYTKPIKEYFSYYGLDFTGINHVFGTFNSANETITAHYFIPNKYRGTVILLHGYQDHTGMLKHLIQNLVDNNYAVGAYDMQGFGISSGGRTSITDFMQYVTVLSDFVNITKTNLHGPYHLIGFSMGGSIVIDYLFSSGTPNTVINKTVLVSPLVRSSGWHMTKLGYVLLNPFTKSIPRTLRRDSTNKTFIEFRKHDPLEFNRITLDWVNAMIKWSNRAETFPVSQKEVLIIQGTKDLTVDWKYNARFLKQKLPLSKIEYIRGIDHHMLNESEPVRHKIFKLINSYLD